MTEFIFNIFNKISGIDLLLIGSYVLALNLFLGGLSKSLEVIKDKTESNLDNKLYGYVNKLIERLQKLVDVLGANRKHK
jgi:hypothetical protein